jgi:2-phosphosulfolactate phosphatase
VFIPPMRIDVALNPAEIALLPRRDLAATTCVVFDVLRATSSIITALANGAAEIHPVRTIEEAHDLRREVHGALLGGERHGERISGFDLGNSPFDYLDVQRRRIVTTTTNGTVALRACEHADRVLVGALLNAGALAEEIAWREPSELLLVCAGTFEEFALEDAYAAGMIVGALCSKESTTGGRNGHTTPELTDSAHAAFAIARQFPTPLAALQAARNGRALAAKGRGKEVEWCAQVSRFNVVGIMDQAVIRSLEA